ncbi:hypothetical protein [Nakamurella aerolata]|uniref:Uncharacterized protein n=1 Tax=Nakamurella aerolata TaxID=1656892 RepID=A0A849A7F2_9ACTN|nr:hypothetical protein [Nakamurella aerolata]NNG35403.1 hypothetical protein [Nakamurella aerolata]
MSRKAGKRSKNIDPTWPDVPEGEHALSEFNADRQGPLSPFGDVEFPRDPTELPYVHPHTVINR